MTLWEYKTLVLPLKKDIEVTKELEREMRDFLNKGTIPSALLNRNIDAEQLDFELNRLGAEGWELVSTSVSTWKGHSRELIASFKRPRQNP